MGEHRGVGGDADRQVNVNEYFATRPDRVIGEIGIRSGQFGPELDVKAASDVDVALELRTRLNAELTRAAGDDPTWTLFGPRTATSTVHRVLRADAPADHQDRHIDAADSGRFSIVSDGQLVEHQVPASQSRELTALLGLRDTTMALLAAESATAEDSEHIDALRHELNTRYDAYAKRWGPINRITYRRTGRVDEVTGEDLLARIAPPQGRFRLDPHSPAVYALEDFDATTGTARKAPIFTGRVVAPRLPRRGADTPADAVAICLTPTVRSTSKGSPAPRPQRGGHPTGPHRPRVRRPINHCGQQHRTVDPRSEYLSGNVRIKLLTRRDRGRTRRRHPDGGRRWDSNIALRQVLPVDHPGRDRRPARRFLDRRRRRAAVPPRGARGPQRDRSSTRAARARAVRGGRHSVLSTSTYGTERMSAGEIVDALLGSGKVRVSDEIEPANAS
jgi:hypothetical protein